MFLFEMTLHFVARFERLEAGRATHEFREDVGVQPGVIFFDVENGVAHGADVVVRHVLAGVAGTAKAKHVVRIRNGFAFRPAVIIFINGHDQRSIAHAEFPFLLSDFGRAILKIIVIVVVVDANFSMTRGGSSRRRSRCL